MKLVVVMMMMMIQSFKFLHQSKAVHVVPAQLCTHRVCVYDIAIHDGVE